VLDFYGEEDSHLAGVKPTVDPSNLIAGWVPDGWYDGLLTGKISSHELCRLDNRCEKWKKKKVGELESDLDAIRQIFTLSFKQIPIMILNFF
jgi:hypothetical protein